MAGGNFGKTSVWLTGLALFGILGCAVWIAVLDAQDWNVLFPIYGTVFVVHPIALLAIIISVVGTTRRRGKPAFGLILVNVALIAVPWIWFGLVT